MGTRGPISWTALGCWVCMLHAWADPGPTSADGRLTPADEFAPGAGFPTAAERGLLRAAGPAATETAVTLATQSPPALSAVAAGADVTMLPGEIAISSGRAGNTSTSLPAEVATASVVSEGNGAIANSVPEPASSLPEPGAGGGEATEIPTEEADTSAGTTNSSDVSPEHGTVATAPAGDAAATSAVFYSSPSGPRPTLFSRSELEVTRSGPGTFSGVTASSPLSAATGNGRTTPGGPGALTSTGTAVSKGTPLSPSAFLSPAALAGETPPPAFVAGAREAGSPGPAETEGEGHPPSGFSSITGLPHLASANATVTGPATPEGRGATGEPVLAAHEETPKSAIDTQSQTNPSPTDTERRLANTEELPTGEPGASSNAKTSPRSLRELGTVTARPTLSGGTAPSASPSPWDIPAEPSHSETDSTGSALAGVSGAPSSPRPSPDAAVGTAPGEGEELTNSAPGPPLSPSAPESASPASAGKGPAGVNVPGGFASAGLAANSAANEAAATSHAGTQSDTDPAPRRAQPSPAPTGELPTGDPGALVMDSPPPSSARETAVSPAPSGNGGDTASLVSAAHGATPISDPNLQSVTNPSPSVPEPRPGDTTGNTAAWANAEASPSPPLGDGTGTGRLAPSGGTSPPALASPSGAPAEPETTGEATPGLSGALQAPRPAPAREPSTATEGTPASVFAGPGDAAFLPSVSRSPGGPSVVGSAPPSSAGERVPVTPVATNRSGGAAGSVPAANKEPTISNPNAQHAGVSPASGAELPPGERGTLAKAETSPGSSLGDGNTTGLHAPSGETSPAAFASPGETAAGPSASETARPGPSLPSAPVPSPASPKRPTVIGPAGATKEAAISGVPPALPGLEAGTGQSRTTPRLATSCTPSAPGSHSPALHSEKGETPPERGANLDSAGASRVPAAATPAPSRGRAETPSPLLGTTALQSDTRAGSDQARTAAVSVGIREATTTGTGQSATALQSDTRAGSDQARTAAVSVGIREATTTGTGQSATVAAMPLYPYGAKETDTRYVERRVDFNSPVFRPEIGFPVGKTLRDSLYFTDNGQIIFPASDRDTFPSPNPPPGGFTGREKVPMVAVFWANADFSKGVGTTFYQEFVTLDSAEHPFVRDVEDKIRRYLKTSYSAKWTLKITWEKAPAYPARPPVTRTNTYQAVLTTDGFKAYALLLYQDGGMQWDYTKLGLTNVLMGYSSGDGLYRNDDLTQRPPAAKYRPDQFRGYNTDLRGLWLYSLASHVQVNYRLRCLAWLSSQQDPAGWNEDLPACPCSLRRGALDRHYRRSRGSADARVMMLYPASPNRYGAGVRCLYDSQNELVDGRQERTWKDSRQASPDRDAELKFHDWCCRQAGSPQLCAKYTQKRPKISCAGYRLPNQSTSSEEAERGSGEGRE